MAPELLADGGEDLAEQILAAPVAAVGGARVLHGQPDTPARVHRARLHKRRPLRLEQRATQRRILRVLKPRNNGRLLSTYVWRGY